MDRGIKLLPVMWVFLCIPRHIHCVKYSNGTSTQCYAYQYPSLFPCAFSTIPICPFLIQRILSFTCVTMINDAKIACTTV